jgi:predicted transcriptional regulator
VTRGYSKANITAVILKACKNGCTKKRIKEEICLSDDQLRRITAELVDKEFLHYIEQGGGVYITTDKGYIFLGKIDRQ